jgi:hypothetical protein
MNRRKLHSQISDCTPQFKIFFEYALDYLHDNNKELVIRPGERIKYGNDPAECTGWCDGDSIEIARELNLFEETFVHEFCHMMQAVEDTHLWNQHQKSNFWDNLNLTLDLKSNDDNDISFWDETYKIIRLEQDCEARALKMNKHWKIFDGNVYAKQANAYLYFYHYVYLTRKWELASSLYCDELIKLMPAKLLTQKQLKIIDMTIMNAYNKVLKK